MLTLLTRCLPQRTANLKLVPASVLVTVSSSLIQQCRWTTSYVVESPNVFFNYSNDKEIEFPVKSFRNGTVVGTANLDPYVFNIKPRVNVLHRVVKWQEKCLQDSSYREYGVMDSPYSGRKLRPQKHTGLKRMGSHRSPLYHSRHIITSHNKLPRDFSHLLPRKVQSLGLRMALTTALIQNKFAVVDQVDDVQSPKTFAKFLLQRGWTPKSNLSYAYSSEAILLFVDGVNMDPSLPVSSTNATHPRPGLVKFGERYTWFKNVPPVELTVKQLVEYKYIVFTYAALEELQVQMRRFKLAEAPLWYKLAKSEALKLTSGMPLRSQDSKAEP